MKKPVYWEAPPEMARGEETQAENSAPKNYGGLKISLLKLGLFFAGATCFLLVLFLSRTLNWWMSLLLALPCYLFFEWLGETVLAEKYGWSTSQVGFSFKRIVLGVLLAFAASGVVYALWTLAARLWAK